jgi:hypothetical protein
MEEKRVNRLKIMYWYNIVVTSGFSLVILLCALFPSLRTSFAWEGTDPVVVSLVVPLFFVIAFFCIRFLSHPAEGILLLRMQVFYKPLAILFLLYFMVTNKIHLFWGILIIAGLLVYIVGNAWAIPWKSKNKKKEENQG